MKKNENTIEKQIYKRAETSSCVLMVKLQL